MTSVVIPASKNLSTAALAHFNNNTKAADLDPNKSSLWPDDAHWSAAVPELSDNDRCFTAPRFLVLTGPGIIPLGIIGSTELGPSGLNTMLQDVTTKCHKTCAPPIELVMERPIVAPWLLATKEFPNEFVTTWTPFPSMKDYVLSGNYCSTVHRDNMYCGFYCAAARAFRDRVLFSASERFVTN
jgi:hypothetical protein